MTNSLKRLTAFALVLVLSLGMIPSAFAAEVDTEPTETEPAATEITEATDPTEPTEPPTTETDGEDEEFDPFAPTPEDLARWAELASQLPEPYTGEWPYDPSVKFPYGEPQENYYPSYILNPDPYGISLLADMSQIPEEMYDNSVLRAMSYAGYDVDWLRDNGYLYVAQYVSSNINSTRPEVLSNIGYDDYSPYLNGDETIADSSTVTGRAPDIAAFEASGLVCASYVSYYINNYLPNIEGVDTSHIADAVKRTTMNNGSYSTASVWSWSTGLDNLASDPTSGVTKYTDEDTAYENLVPGDVIVFSRDGDLVHVAIYAGTYTFFNASGTNRGEAHYISHVGNSRGPELSTTAYMANAGSKGSTPSAWYHIEYPQADPPGYIEVNKTDPNGKGLSGAVFEAVHQASGEVFTIGPTSSSGYAISGELPLGTFTVTESVFPSGYQSSGTSQWTVTITEDTPNCTITLDVVNDPKTGNLAIQKTTSTGTDLQGWRFGIYADQSCSVLLSGPHTTNSQGKISATGLSPGVVYVKELGHSDAAINAKYQCTSPNPQKVTITANKTATVSFKNDLLTGVGKIIKQTNTGENLSGWKFNVYSDAACKYPIDGSPFTTNQSGEIVLTLTPSDYYVQEVDESASHPAWTYDTTVRKLTVTAGGTASVVFENTHYGYAKIVKETSTGGSLAGWKFDIFTDAACTQLLPGSPFVSGEDGTVVARILPGNYFIVERKESELHPDWVFDEAIHVVTVQAGQTAVVTIRNTQLGQAKIIKSMPDGGSVAGWEFDVYRVKDNAFIGTFISGEDGTILTGYLDPGEYQIYEKIPDGSIYQCDSANPQTVTVMAGQTAAVTFVNRIRPGEITIQKVDQTGTPRAGAEFLLEWSEDGSTWLPVVYSDAPQPSKGSCSTPGLEDGRLTSGEDGSVTFQKLHPGLYYRLTETKAPDGFQLLTGYAYEGQLPGVEDYMITLTVVNVPTFTLPETGAKSITLTIISLCVCLAGLAGALIYLRKRRW